MLKEQSKTPTATTSVGSAHTRYTPHIKILTWILVLFRCRFYFLSSFFLQSPETPEECTQTAVPQPDADASAAEGHGQGHDHDHHHGRHHGHGGAHDFHPRGLGYGHHHHHGHHHGGDDGTGQHHNHGHGQRSHDFSRHDGHHSADPDLIQHVMQVQLMPQEEAQGAPVRSWDQTRVKWKSKYSWQLSAGSDGQTSTQLTWCWHWRRLFESTGGQQPVGLWHCEEGLPASWWWHRLTGDVTDNVRETWQWRSPLVDWQQNQPAPWAWPPGVVSWGWEQL